MRSILSVRQAIPALLLLTGLSTGLIQPLTAQATSFRYFYDDSNELYRVLDSTGTLIEYTIDPSGNITNVSRTSLPPSQLSILNVTPSNPGGGSRITILGQNFSAIAAGNTVTIGGVTATVISATATELVVLVPGGTPGGAVSVTVGGVTATWSGTITIPPAVFDLSSDWSNTSNPNGPWSYNQGTTPLPFVPNWNANNTTWPLSCNQPAWAPSNAPGRFLPPVLQVNACAAADQTFSPDPNNPPQKNIAVGDVIVHTVDPGSGGQNLGVNVLFTLPASGVAGAYTISGSLWDTGVLSISLSRPQAWFLLLNGTQIASGRLSGTVSRSQAQTFSTIENLKVGDQVELLIVKDPTAPFGYFVGINLTIAQSFTGGSASPSRDANRTVSMLQETRKTPAPGTGGRQGPADGRPFSVLAIAPADRAARIGPQSAVTLAFSAPLDPASITPGNFSLFAGGKALDPVIRYSADFRTVTLGASLPLDASVLVQISDQVRDLWGRRLPAFQSEFHTTGAQPGTNQAVIAQHPAAGATGVSPGAAIHLSLGRAVDWNLARGALSITQDGEPVEGRIQITQGGREIEFVPYAPFRFGAVVRVSLGGTDGNAAQLPDRYEGLFTTAAAVDATAEPLRTNPGSASGAPLNAVMEFEYSHSLDRATVAWPAVTLSAATPDGEASSRPVAAAVMMHGDHTIRVVPSVSLSPGSGYTVEISASVRDMAGRSVSPIRRSFTAGNEPASGVPRLLSTIPGNGAADVDASSEVHLLFDRPINPLTLDVDTVRLSVDGVAVAASMSLGSGGSEAIVSPLMPLKDSGRVQLTMVGVEDLAGNILPSSTIHFQVRRAPEEAGAQLARNGEVGRYLNGSARRRFIVFLIGGR